MILVIDDNEDVRYTIKEICEYAGWEVIEAENGKEGMEYCKKIKPSLIFVDYHMPVWDGLTTVKEIRKFDHSTPIIVLTVEERQEIADHFLNAGATDFALKPIKAPDLISRIRLNLKISRLQEDTHAVFVDKGINSQTLNSIKYFLINQSVPLTIQEITEELPIAYQTVHRYLNYLAEKGEVEVISHYGNKGRPKNKYRMI